MTIILLCWGVLSFHAALLTWPSGCMMLYQHFLVLGQCSAHVYLEDALVVIRPCLFLVVVVVVMVFDVLYSFVQTCAVTAVENHRMVLSLGQSAVWLSFLARAVPAVSWTPDICHLAGMIDAVACGLSSSSSASTLWVDRHSMPWACLPYPWVVSPWLDRHSVLWACLPPSWVDVVCLDGSLRMMGRPATASQDC